MNPDSQGMRRRQTLGIGGVEVDDQADLSFSCEVAAADSQAPNFDEAGQGGRRTDHQCHLVRPDVDAVVPDQHGGRNLAGAASEHEIEGKARFAGTRGGANEHGAITDQHGGSMDGGFGRAGHLCR